MKRFYTRFIYRLLPAGIRQEIDLSLLRARASWLGVPAPADEKTAASLKDLREYIA